MLRWLQTLALVAAFIVLCAGLWQGWAFSVTLRKMVLSYLALFLVGGLAALAFQAVGRDSPEDPEAASGPSESGP